jgi:hypothetical protein
MKKHAQTFPGFIKGLLLGTLLGIVIVFVEVAHTLSHPILIWTALVSTTCWLYYLLK